MSRTIDWAALSRRALLHQVACGDAQHALSLLRRQLVEAGRDAAIGWSADGRQHWIDDRAPAPHAALAAVWAGATAQRDGGRWWLPLDHLAARVGVLCLQADETDTLNQFEPLVEAAAALAALCAQPRQAHDGDGATLRAALRGAGTFVWEWRPDTDVLSDVEQGMAMLDYGNHDLAPTQDAWNSLIHPDDLAKKPRPKPRPAPASPN